MPDDLAIRVHDELLSVPGLDGGGDTPQTI
jgi:hypothetical protein